jgi:hypothetical protein
MNRVHPTVHHEQSVCALHGATCQRRHQPRSGKCRCRHKIIWWRTQFACWIWKWKVVKVLSNVKGSFETNFCGLMSGKREKINRTRHNNRRQTGWRTRAIEFVRAQRRCGAGGWFRIQVTVFADEHWAVIKRTKPVYFNSRTSTVSCCCLAI